MKNVRFFPQILLILLIGLGFSQILVAQTSSQKLTGTVVNEAGEAIAGALILRKGSKSGTATDQNGHFSLTIPTLPTVLEISFIDYDTEELNVTGLGPIKVYLKKTAVSNLFFPSNESNFQVVGQVDEIPQPVTGIEEWKSFIAKTITYPSEDRKARIQGTIIATFEVSRQGKVENLDLLRSIGGAADQEVLRVIAAGPDWIPGKVNGQPVTTRLRIPVLFKIQSDDPKDQTLQRAEGAIAASYGRPFVVIGYPSVSPTKVNLPTPIKPRSIR
jgi:TonB family protein